MPQEFNTNMLLLARQYRGRSQESVAEACGLNQGHYSRIENGLMPEGPAHETVEKIAAALQFNPSFFYLTNDIAGLPLSVHPMTRKKASLGERALKNIHAEINIRLIHLRKLLRAVTVSSELPLPEIDVDEGGGPASIARKVRNLWGVPDGPVQNLTDLCERAGLLIIGCEFDAGIDGVTMRIRDLPVCIFLNSRAPADRMRMSLAHELGHVVMHRYPTDSIEEEANEFAAELLVPEKLFKRQLIGRRITLELLARQKAYWKASMNFLLLRAGRIGYLNSNQSEYLWKLMSMRGWRTHEPTETEFNREHPSVFPRIVKLHANGLDYSPGDFSKFLDMPEADVLRLYGENIIGGPRRRLHLIK
jgi:Zn-dependent peptidase ImmA (M78 family)